MFLTVVTTSSVAKPNKITSKKCDAIIKDKLPTANVGYLLMDAKTGKVLLQRHGHKLFKPASNAKHFVTAAALNHLRADYVYKTELLAEPNKLKQNRLMTDLVVRFSGDPSLKSKHINELFAEIKKLGIDSLQGDVIIDDSIFHLPAQPPGYSMEDVNKYYAAPVTAIIIDENRLHIRITAAEKLNQPVKVKSLLSYHNVTVENQTKTVLPSQVGPHCPFVLDIEDDNLLQLEGCWPNNQKFADRSMAISDPLERAKQAIIIAMQKSQIHHEGHYRRGIASKKVQAIAVHESAPLKELIKPVMKESDNLYANALFKTLGDAIYGQGSFKQGKRAVLKILKDMANVDSKKIRITDGSGSRYNMVSPYSISQLLYAVYHSETLRPDYLDALPIAKVDGTLAWRFGEKKLPGKLQAKTGTMHDISALSGYFWLEDGHPYIFAILINNVLDVKVAKRVEEDLVMAMIESLRG